MRKTVVLLGPLLALVTLCRAHAQRPASAVPVDSQTGAPISAPLQIAAASIPAAIFEALPYAPVPTIPVAMEPVVDAAVRIPPCTAADADARSSPETDAQPGFGQPCIATANNPYRQFLDSTAPIPMTPRQKGLLALRNLGDPGNLATIAGNAAFTVATNAHTAYGPGFNGFGRDVGYSLLQDGTGQFFGVFLIPSVAGEDPHYHRMPYASVPRRIVHAVSRTLLAQSDYGATMPNFAALATYPISAELSNLYVPGIHGNGPSTADRILTGYATDPANNLITEFLPDVARHIHVQVLFVQRILNQVSGDQTPLP